VFNQRQLIQALFLNSSLSDVVYNHSDDGAVASNISYACPAVGQPFQVIASTLKHGGGNGGNGGNGDSPPPTSFVFSEGAVTLRFFLLFLASRFVLTPLALQVPLVPSGVFTPLFLLGALIGRAWGVVFACLLESISAQAAAAQGPGAGPVTELNAAE
jgi:hypothetical protein